MDNVLGKDCSGKEIIPIAKKLKVKTNRHPNTDGTEWGWIEGCTKNIVWSNNPYSKFNQSDALNLVSSFNAL